MLRIKDPKVSVPFYVDHFGFTLLHKIDFPEMNFSLFFLAILPEGETYDLTPGTPESHKFLFNYKGVTLELTHNHGSEDQADFAVNNGNVEPHRGFGHIAVMTKDVYACSAELEAAGVKFQKRPDEGNMKGLAFALDPDGYWIELVKRNEESKINNKYAFAQTMLRVKDAKKSVAFYKDLLGMNLVRTVDVSKFGFSLYFMCHAEEGVGLSDIFDPVIELTHNHGTEDKEDFNYHNGNDEDKEKGMLRGFGHTGFLTPDLEGACKWLEEKGVPFKKKPDEGKMRGIAFVLDPDGYWVELIQTDMKYGTH